MYFIYNFVFCKKNDKGNNIYVWKMCNVLKNLCFLYIEHEENDGSDYSDYYCDKCWKYGTEYRDLILIHKNEIEELYQECTNACKPKDKFKKV